MRCVQGWRKGVVRLVLLILERNLDFRHLQAEGLADTSPGQAQRRPGLRVGWICTPKVCRSARRFLHTFGVRKTRRPISQGGAALALGWYPPGLRPENQCR